MNLRNSLKLPTIELPSPVSTLKKPNYSLNPMNYKRKEQNDSCNIDNNDFTWQQCKNNVGWEQLDLTVFPTQPNSNNNMKIEVLKLIFVL